MKDKQVLVSGPVNTVRLEGKIGDIDKVLYVMFDFHMDVQAQTKCEDIRAQNIVDYLVQNFDRVSQSDKQYDFFFETYPYVPLHLSYLAEHQKYGWELVELFKKSFNYDPKTGKVRKSTEFPNIKFHYIDIRNYFKTDLDNTEKYLQEYIDKMYDSRSIYKDDIDTLLNGIFMFLSKLIVLYDLLFRDSIKKKGKRLPIIPESLETYSKYTYEQINSINKIIIDKIKNKYVYHDIKKVFNNYLDTELKNQFDTLNKKLAELNTYVNSIKDNIQAPEHLAESKTNGKWFYWQHQPEVITMITKIYNMYYDIADQYEDLMVKLVDLFFLRRFLDKDYITNALIYTGALHSIFYIYMLVKYFDFKVTHASYVSQDISKINNTVKKSPSDDILTKYFYPPHLYQCSDLTGFPPLFS